MKALAVRTMTGVCLGLLLFYAYAFATVEPAPVWNPPIVVTWGCCYWIGGMPVCIPCRSESETRGKGKPIDHNPSNTLMPENKKYMPIKILPHNDFQIFGVVTNVIRKVS